MLDEMDQYPTFAPYSLNYGSFDPLDMKVRDLGSREHHIEPLP